MKLEQILTYHRQQYPLMGRLDYQKLVYQHTFGSHHILSLQPPILNMKNTSNHVLFEPLGNHLYRFYLDAGSPLSANLMKKMFQLSAQPKIGTLQEYQDNLNILQKFLSQKEPHISFDMPQTIPMPFAHSPTYKKAYAPQYYLVHEVFKEYYPLLLQLDSLLQNNPRLRIIIDGCCASGKTTLAKLLAQLFNASIISMDDYFLREEQHSIHRDQEIGGNIDYERFLSDVIPHLSSPKDFMIYPYDCHRQSYQEAKPIKGNKPIIIEGAYALHPKFTYPPHYAIFLEIDKEQQIIRLKKRNPTLLNRFIKEWIPKENAYFKLYKIQQQADIFIYNNHAQKG